MSIKNRKDKKTKNKRDKLKMFVFSLVGLLVVLMSLLCFYEIQRRSTQQEDISYLPETGEPIVLIADDPYIPSGTERPEDYGWIFLGDGFDTTAFDIDSIDFKGAPRKIRYVMFLNGSAITCGDCIGADPDGVTGYHTVGGGLSYGNAIYLVDTAPRGSVHGKKCENYYTCSLHANKVLGEPEDCGSTKNCGCCLGKDPTPSLEARDAQGGFLIIDMACNDIDTSGLYRKCRSSEAEDHNQVIVGDGTSAVDMIFYEVGCSEHYFLYAYPYWIPPVVEVTKPDDCSDETTITITATDSKGSQNISKFWLYLNGDMSGPWVVTSDRSAVYLDVGGRDDFNAGIPNFSQSWSEAYLTFNLTGLQSLYHDTNVEVFAEAEDIKGRKSEKVSGGSFQTGGGPTISITDISYLGDDSIQLSWLISSNLFGVSVSDCYVKWRLEGSGVSWDSDEINSVHISDCSQTSYTITSIDPYLSYEFRVEAKTCEVSYAEEETASPWFMTHFGDTYASLGYNLEMQDVSSYGLLGISPGNAYFSHYLISTGNNIISITRSSRRRYTLTNYSDTNTDIEGSGFNIFDKLISIANANGCDIKGRSDLLTDGCSGVDIYFIEDGNPVNLDGGWLNQPADPNRACIIVANGDIVISAGSDQGDDIDKMDVFLISEKQIKTNRDNEILLINGSVIANSVDFGRNLMQDNTDDPAEVIRYDPKYFDYFRKCLGMDYPQKFREYQYSGLGDE